MKKWIHASNDNNYDYAKVEQAARKCKEIQDIICDTIDISFSNNWYASGNQCFDKASEGHDSDSVSIAYDILSSMYDLDSEKLFEQVQPDDIVCLVFAEITPQGDVYTNDSGLLASYPTLQEYREQYKNSNNEIKTLYCSLAIVAVTSNRYGIDDIVPGALGQLADKFTSLGYFCYPIGVVGLEIATSKKNLLNRKTITITIDPVTAKSKTSVLIPGQYLDAVRGKLNIPQSFINEVCNRVDALDKAYKEWPREDYWYMFDPDSEKMDKAWEKYLKKPENKVNSKLKVFPEPSVQGMLGYVIIHDESGTRGWEEEPKVSYSDWVEAELDMAKSSKSSSDYEKKYESYIKEIIS